MPYFDHAATTSLSKSALDAMNTVFKEYYGNPSSLHDVGIKARKLMNQTKNELASLLSCERKNVIVTASGTEANNIAIQGVYNHNPSLTLITSEVEHHATLNTIKYLKSKGANVIILPVNNQGHILLEDLEDALKKGPSLVSLIYANNEIGTLLNHQEVNKLCKKYHALLHLDMVQAPLHEVIDFKALDVDFVSISAHKFHGPKGIGLLLARDLNNFDRIIHGGKQEFEKRSGTENLASLVGMLTALKEAYQKHDEEYHHLKELSHYFIEQLNQSNIHYTLNGPKISDRRLNSILNLGFYDIDAQWLSFELNQRGIHVSLGSACDSDNIEPSHVLKALKVDEKFIHGSLRFSLGLENQKQDIDEAISVLKELLNDA